MSDTSRPPCKLQEPPGKEFLRVVRQLNRIAVGQSIAFFPVRASAREIVLVNLLGLPAGRAALDLDFVFAVNNRAEFTNPAHWPTIVRTPR